MPSKHTATRPAVSDDLNAPGVMSADSSITLVGMAGCGKSTVGRLLARALGMGCVDTDHLMEAYYGVDLETVFQTLGRDAFLHAEEALVAGLGARRCVISTGGSVIYGAAAMTQLRSLGPIVHLRASLETVRRRLEACGTRGLAIAPGQSFEALFAEREPLYEAFADLTVSAEEAPEAVAQAALRALEEWSPPANLNPSGTS